MILLLAACFLPPLAFLAWVTVSTVRKFKEGSGHTAFWYTIGGD